jgi:cellulose synthase/poly-beta-1,6-N-acetylglucosamine synthase-like glycosyltransferase
MTPLQILSEVVFLLCLVLLIYAYIGYPWILRLLVRRRINERLPTGAFHPKITVLIPVHNEERVIRQKLENCLMQDYPQDRLEIMICSDCSDDRTERIVHSFLGGNVTFYDYRDRSGKTGVINKSLPKATGEIVILTDANVMFEQGAIQKMVNFYCSPDIGAVCGQVRLVVPAGAKKIDKEIAYRNFETELKHLEGLWGSTIGAFGGFYSIRKELFRPLPDVAYNDDILIPMQVLRIGKKVVFEKEAISMESTSLSIQQEFKRRIRIGAGNFQAFFLLRDMLSPSRGMTCFFYFSHKVLRWFSPFLLLGLILSNALLIGYLPFAVLFFCQLLFYAVSVAVGILFSSKERYVPFLSGAYHFLMMNLAFFLGFLRFCRGIESAAWQTTDRAQG